MNFRIWYGKLYTRLFMAALVLLFFLAWQLLEAQKKEQSPVLLKAELPAEEITAELLAQMEELSGFQKRWVLYEKECEIQVGRYSAEISITGVDFSGYPLTVMASAGKKAAGSVPFLAVGESFFGGLRDENGETITERQAEILAGTYEELQITLKTDMEKSTENPAAMSGTEASAGECARLLAIVKEEGVYMDASLMQRWLESRGERQKINGVMLKIRGEGNAAKAKELMEKAGFTVEAVGQTGNPA